jgi:hypothetical protein
METSLCIPYGAKKGSERSEGNPGGWSDLEKVAPGKDAGMCAGARCPLVKAHAARTQDARHGAASFPGLLQDTDERCARGRDID